MELTREHVILFHRCMNVGAVVRGCLYGFGRQRSQSVMGVQMAVSYVGIMLAPALFGVLAQRASAGLFPFYLAVLYLLMMAGSFFHVLKRNTK